MPNKLKLVNSNKGLSTHRLTIIAYSINAEIYHWIIGLIGVWPIDIEDNLLSIFPATPKDIEMLDDGNKEVILNMSEAIIYHETKISIHKIITIKYLDTFNQELKTYVDEQNKSSKN